MKMPDVKPYSRLTHEASKWAKANGNFDEYSKAVFRGYFERSEDIGKSETLLSIASNIGLETESLQLALENRDFLADVLKDEIYAEQIGINAVPAFIADGKRGLSGLQPVANLRKLIESV